MPDHTRYFCPRCQRTLRNHPAGGDEQDTVTAPQPAVGADVRAFHDDCGGEVLLSNPTAKETG